MPYSRRHRFMDDLVLRVIYEDNDEIVVVTVYPARRRRYAETV
jgi:UDP-N-acetylmuramate-alanine ligase